MKKKKKSALADEENVEENVEEDPTIPPSPSRPCRIPKLVIKPGKGTKGGKKEL